MHLKVLAFTLAFVALASAHGGSRTRSRSGRRNRRPSNPSLSYGAGIGYQGYYGDYYQDEVVIPRRVGSGRCGRTLTKADCPLFDYGSNLVTKEMFIANVMAETSSGWILLKSLKFDFESDKIGKCAAIWYPPSTPDDEIFTKSEFCYNLDSKQCESFSEIMRLSEDDCGRVRLLGVNGTSTEEFYSQDITTYFWRDLCLTKVGDTCQGGRFLDLDVKGSRILNNPERAPDLTGLPWDLIAADLKNIFSKDIRDPDVRNPYLGIELSTGNVTEA